MESGNLSSSIIQLIYKHNIIQIKSICEIYIYFHFIEYEYPVNEAN